MHRLKPAIFIIFLGIVILVGFLSIRFPTENPQTQKIEIFASFYPLAHIATKVGGEYVSVHNMLPPGGEPHDFEPALRDFVALGNSTLFLYNGGNFEPWIEKWREGSFARPPYVLDMIHELKQRGVSLIENNGQINPHIWIDPALFIQELEVVRDTLIQIDPVHANDYQTNADRFAEVLIQLDQNFRKGLAQCEKKEVVVSHDAFKYLSKEYGFRSIPIAGISPDEEPSLKILAQISDIARAKNLKYIFFETTVSPKLSETIAREIGASVLVLNPLETITENGIQLGEDYISTMTMNLNNLRKALVCQ